MDRTRDGEVRTIPAKARKSPKSFQAEPVQATSANCRGLASTSFDQPAKRVHYPEYPSVNCGSAVPVRTRSGASLEMKSPPAREQAAKPKVLRSQSHAASSLQRQPHSHPERSKNMSAAGDGKASFGGGGAQFAGLAARLPGPQHSTQKLDNGSVLLCGENESQKAAGRTQISLEESGYIAQPGWESSPSNTIGMVALQQIIDRNMLTLQQLQHVNDSKMMMSLQSHPDMAHMCAQNSQTMKLIMQGTERVNNFVDLEKSGKATNMHLQKVVSPGKETVSTAADSPSAGAPSGGDVWTPYVRKVLELKHFINGLPGPQKRVIDQIVIMEDPAIHFYKGLLSSDECQKLIALCEGRWLPSQTSKGKLESDPKNYVGGTSKNRTSDSVRMTMGENKFVSMLERRVAAAAEIPLKHLESLVVVRYKEGQFFNEHHDGDFRLKTLLLYLSECEGGETEFSQLGIKVKPDVGNALTWWNVTNDGRGDFRLLHSGLAPTRGTKYAVNCFFSKSEVRKDN